MSLKSLLSTTLVRASSLSDKAYDGVILVTSHSNHIANHPAVSALSNTVQNFLKVHRGGLSAASLLAVDENIIPSGRLIIAGTGPVERDYDDVRRFQTAAKNGVKLALSAGFTSPLLVTVPHARYPQAELVSALGALYHVYTPLNVREEENVVKFNQMGILPLADPSGRLVQFIEAYEAAFTVCRDVGETGPERMAPPRTAEYIQKVFDVNGNVKVSVVDDQNVILKEYPLMHAVNRCANQVKAHQSRLIRLEYVGEGPITDTYMLVGKGVTIDTGGADLKTGGHMWGMCRDKYGSGVLAGFFKTLDILKPKGIKIGYMCMVRNSIGSHAYTTDEVITARSGKRIHIYNTDAEGRVTMLDPLTYAKDEALNEVNPHLITLATLTGHEILTYGYYSTIMDNGPAKQSGWARRIQETGDIYGQPIEISRLQPEDYAFHMAECQQADIRQSNTKPSVATMRGHMSPAAFLIMASRLDEHGTDSKKPLKFSHIDMGGSAGDHPETSFPNPLVTLVAGLVLPKL